MKLLPAAEPQPDCRTGTAQNLVPRDEVEWLAILVVARQMAYESYP